MFGIRINEKSESVLIRGQMAKSWCQKNWEGVVWVPSCSCQFPLPTQIGVSNCSFIKLNMQENLSGKYYLKNLFYLLPLSPVDMLYMLKVITKTSFFKPFQTMELGDLLTLKCQLHYMTIDWKLKLKPLIIFSLYLRLRMTLGEFDKYCLIMISLATVIFFSGL